MLEIRSNNISELNDETTYPVPLVFCAMDAHRRLCQLHARDGAAMIEFCDMMLLPCGGVAYYDEERFGVDYFCLHCGAIVGSDQQPEKCKTEEQKWHLQKLLGGEGWDYFRDLEQWD